ncbi:MAG: LysM peptidoglycan-binding domain-containing protein [Deltaproteobacteria bacterium]|nr:MAG: LysM peptidoglycan-binding domain-containing protein [Deltaproteobacteria bacterium]
MIEIEKKDFETVVDEIVTAKDLRLIIEKSLKNHHHYRSIILDISKGSKSRNFRVIKEIAKNRKISDRFIVDQARSVISFFNQGAEEDLDDYYEILQCSLQSDDEDIRNNWIRLMKLYHPDKIGEPGLEKTKKINEAYNILIDPVSREHYDKSYFPDIPVRIKNLDYIQFKNRRFLAVLASLLLLIPVFYIYKSLTSSEVNIEYSEKPDKSADLNDANDDKSSIKIANNEKIVDTESSNIDTGADNAFVKEEDLDSLKDESYKDKKDNTVSVSDFDETDSEAIVIEENNIANVEANSTDSIEIVDTQSSDIDTDTDNAFVKEQDLDSVTDEVYNDTKDNAASVNNLDEIEGGAIVQKQNLGDEIEEAAEDSLDMAGDAEIAWVKIDDNKIDESVYTKLESVVENEKEIESDVGYKSSDPIIPQKYTVKKGDSLWSLSDKFDISINEIKKQNSLNKNTIKPGESLILSKTDDYTGADKLSKIQVASGIDKNLKDSTNNITVASKKQMIDEAITINNNLTIKKKKPIKVRNVEELELSLLKVNNINTPNKSSVYTAISDYIFAYKNRDMKKLGTLFDVNAKENGVSMDKVFKMYRKNFEELYVVAYDIKFNKVNLDKRKATVDGDFIISFTNTSEDVFKKSYGDINWKLTWNDNSWLINEIRYKVTSTKVGDDLNKQY